MYDRQLARAVSEKSFARIAAQIAKGLDYADVIDAKTKAWADELDPETLTPMEAAALSRVSLEIKNRSFETADGTASFPVGLPMPTFTIQVIHIPPLETHARVQLDGQPGVVARSELERFKRDYPHAIIIA